MKTEKFKDILIDIPTSIIYLKEGDGFNIEYNIPSSYSVIEQSVKNERLTFICKYRFPAALFHWDISKYFVEITYPKETKFDNVEVNVISGKIVIKKINSNYINLGSVSGGIEINGMISDISSRISCTSGSIDILSMKTNDLNAKTVSGSIKGYDIVSSKLNANTISGSIKFSGDLTGEIKLKTVSGSINCEILKLENLYNWSLHSVSGKTKVNGDDCAKNTRNPAPNLIEAKTTSGSININFKK